MNMKPIYRSLICWPVAVPFFILGWMTPCEKASKSLMQVGWKVLGLGDK